MAKESSIVHLEKSGKIKLPLAFRRAVEKTAAGEVFVTSLDDRNIQIYPLMTWHKLVDKLFKEKRDDLLLRKFLIKTNYFGSKAGVDKYGRVQIAAFYRKKIKLEGKIAIEEKDDHLELITKKQ